MSTTLRLRIAAAVVDSFLREERVGQFISEADVAILAYLTENDGPSGSDIARWCGRTRSNAHRALRRLERRHLVEKLPSVVTGKTCGWTITEPGRRVWREASARLAHYDRLLEGAHPEFRQAVDVIIAAMHRVLFPSEGSFRRYVRPPRRTRPLQWDL